MTKRTPERARAMGAAGLTERQRQFVDEYMLDHNASAAALRMGIPAHLAEGDGPRMLRYKVVQDAVNNREEKRAERIDVTQDDIVRELKSIAFFDVRTLFDPVTKQFRKDPFDMNEDELRALVNFDIVVLDKTGGHIVKAQPGNKMKALELLGKQLGMFKDKVEHSGTVVNYVTDFGLEEKPEEKSKE
jgi:phage terminase small subunit